MSQITSGARYRAARAYPHGSWHQGPTPRTELRRACPCTQKTGEWGKHRSRYISRGRTCICPELFQAKEGALCEIPPSPTSTS